MLGQSIRLSHVVLGVVTTDTPCLGLQLTHTWILHGVQFNQYLTWFAYLSFSTVKAHNVCNKIIQLNSMTKFFITLLVAVVSQNLLNLLLLRHNFYRKTCFSFLNNSMDTKVTYQ